MRNLTDEALLAMDAALRSACAEVGQATQVSIAVEQVVYYPPCHFAPDCIASVRGAADALGLEHMEVVSGAGHDAVYLANKAPTAMIFAFTWEKSRPSNFQAKDRSARASPLCALLNGSKSFLYIDDVSVYQVDAFSQVENSNFIADTTGWAVSVGINALDLVTRQLTLASEGDAAEHIRLKQLLGADGSLIELNRALSDKIAKGDVDLQTPGLTEHLWQTTMDKLAVDQPNYGSYKRELGDK